MARETSYKKASDKYLLPIKDKETGIAFYTKQSFWFNNDFVKRIVDKQF